MRIKLRSSEAWLIGDPHLGRDFKNGTPLHRRGEREEMQMAQFKDELATEGVSHVIMVGDLFDKPFVSLTLINDAIDAVVDAAQARPNVRFIFMAGNHDKSRQIGTKGAWELFSVAVGWLPNVVIVDEPMAIDGMMLYPWQWGVSALEQVQPNDCDIAIGHWDLKSFGGDDSHICPVKALLALNPNLTIYSGHYHEEKTYDLDGVDIHCTGSMQPYTHGEDPDATMYVTLTLEEALARDDLENMCVRVILEPGETLPPIDCLQLTTMRADQEAEEIDMGEIGIGAFDIKGVLAEQFRENQVPDQVQTFIKEKMGDFA